MTRPEERQLPVGLSAFTGETRLGHALLVIVGAAGFVAGYLGCAVLFFEGLETFGPGAPRGPSLIAGAFGSLGCWGVFAVGFVRGRGGPVLNAVVYPVPIVAVLPVAVRWAVFGPEIGGLLDRFGFVLFPVEVLVSAAALILPGAVFFASLLAVWAAALDEDRRRAWQREQLSPEFYEEFVEESER
ncbi:hypothetical protein AArcCO_0631 [Halalkaliarchaeum sp. AArc-CO]|uniref:hypothetical protein n=1 Tax=unclassified Halalkaliarchaeum TaxID=2678344 RepID=UPI00217D0511|nr:MULTISPECIES: hypothetical protein [unclassified Halalkaliarchaeum]MDR5672414.1 hypothetical protein [Halalkaliarchaeum sp. AArc-GB]UWG49953.1 hypothetical protein AArcCO_0631 [Halalkaliarchaeum sp. AArc-CO]